MHVRLAYQRTSEQPFIFLLCYRYMLFFHPA